MTRAHIYIRFSHIDQREGTSTARQRKDCLAYIQQKNWELGEILIDEGRSGFHGANRMEGGALRRFEDEAEAGEHFGDILVVERLDRLSRQGHDETSDFIRKLTRHGVSVATVDGDAFYKAGEKFDLHQILTMLIKAETAHEESAKKAARSREAHAIRRKEVAENGGVLRAVCPAWLERKNGSYIERKERVALIQEIFQLADDGQGSIRIAKILNQRGEPLWTRARGKQQKAWDNGRIRKFLADPAVLGEYHAHSWQNGKFVATGLIIRGIFPRIIETEQFDRIRASASIRAQTKGGGRSSVVANLFSGLAKCAHCGGPMEYMRRRKAGAEYTSRGKTQILKHEDAALYCRAAYRHAQACANRTGITYFGLEKALLDSALHIALDDRAFARSDETAKLARDIADKEREAEQARNAAESLWTAWAADGQKSDMKMRLAEQSEARSVMLDAEVETLRKALAKAAGQASSAEHLSRIAEIRAHLYDDDLELRAKHRRKVMEGLRSVITFMGCDDTRTVQIAFAGGLKALEIRGGKVCIDRDISDFFKDGQLESLGGEHEQKAAQDVMKRLQDHR